MSDFTVLQLKAKARDALYQARRMPIGEQRNELRQVAVCYRWMADRQMRRLAAGLFGLKATSIVQHQMDDEATHTQTILQKKASRIVMGDCQFC